MSDTKIEIVTDVAVRDIACNLSYLEAEELITEIDRQMDDYDFTLHMAKYFIQELKEEHEATGEEFNIEKVLGDAI